MKEPKSVGSYDDPCFEVNSADVEPVYFKTIEGVEIPNPVLTKIIWPGPRGTILEHSLAKGQVLPMHVHHSEFVNFLIRGKLAVNLAGQRYEAGKWDTWTALPGVEHSIEALEDSAVIDFFVPPGVILKDSFLTWGSSQPSSRHYFTRYADAREIPVDNVEGLPVTGFSAPQKFLVHGPNLSMNLAHLKPGKRTRHTHWHNFFCYMVEGRFQCWQGGREFDATAGHYWGAAPGVEHANFSPGASIALDWKWPPPQVWFGRLKSWEAPIGSTKEGK